MKKTIFHSLFAAFLLTVVVILPSCAQTPAEWQKLKAGVNLYWVNDMGRNGYYDQKTIAELMGKMALTVGPEAIIAVGDVHHFNGVQSTSDPLWMTNYELVYSNPELMEFWYPVLGNHEYRGNTQAVLDYAKVSRRWAMPARYYSKVFRGKGCKLRIVFIDTTPLIDCYRNDSTTYPDAHKQDRERQLAWLDSTLTAAHEDWVICVGHHPIYAQGRLWLRTYPQLPVHQEAGRPYRLLGELRRRALPSRECHRRHTVVRPLYRLHHHQRQQAAADSLSHQQGWQDSLSVAYQEDEIDRMGSYYN